MLLLVPVTPANINDRAILDPMLRVLRRRFPLIGLTWADDGYPGPAVAWARDKLQLIVQIVKRTDDVTGFQVLPRRWAVERPFAWIMHRRRCARDYERLDAHHEAIVTWALTILMTPRLAKHTT
jgi:transposase